MKLKLLATAISSTLLIGCGSDDSLPKVTEGTYYNATPLTIGEFTNVTINSGEQLEAFKVTVPSTGSNRTITTVIDIVEPTPYAEFWYQDKSVLFGQLMPEQDIHDALAVNGLDQFCVTACYRIHSHIDTNALTGKIRSYPPWKD